MDNLIYDGELSILSATPQLFSEDLLTDNSHRTERKFDDTGKSDECDFDVILVL